MVGHQEPRLTRLAVVETLNQMSKKPGQPHPNMGRVTTLTLFVVKEFELYSMSFRNPRPLLTSSAEPGVGYPFKTSLKEKTIICAKPSCMVKATPKSVFSGDCSHARVAVLPRGDTTPGSTIYVRRSMGSVE